jgi:hypothetical protein
VALTSSIRLTIREISKAEIEKEAAQLAASQAVGFIRQDGSRGVTNSTLLGRDRGKPVLKYELRNFLRRAAKV